MKQGKNFDPQGHMRDSSDMDLLYISSSGVPIFINTCSIALTFDLQDCHYKADHSLRVLMASHTASLLGLLAPITIFMLALLGAPATVFAKRGQATYYGPPFTPSACYEFDTSRFPAGHLIAAASPGLFNRGGARKACGAYYRVTCKGATSGAANACTRTPTVTVKVVDLCPGCHEPGLDLSPKAFSRIAKLDVGRINIEFTRL